MFKYEGMTCPVCHQVLTEDDTVICPECGMPHHRQCYKELGHCFCEDKHGTPEQWQMPEKENEDQEEIPIITKCSNCGHEIKIGDKYCTNCRKPVNDEIPNPFANENSQGQHLGDENEENQNSENAQNPFFIRNGLDKDELIDGEKTSDIACFVGYNALRYIRIFKKFAQRKKNGSNGIQASWNWVSFFFPDLWLFSRKCYKAGFITGFIRVFITVMFELIGGSDMLSQIVGQTDVNTSFMSIEPTTIALISILWVISMGMMLIGGIFGDYIYKRNVYHTLKVLRENNMNNELFMMRAGGVNLFVTLLAYWGIYLVSTIVINLVL